MELVKNNHVTWPYVTKLVDVGVKSNQNFVELVLAIEIARTSYHFLSFMQHICIVYSQ